MLVDVTGAAVSRRTERPELAVQAVELVNQLPNGRLVPVDAQLARLAAGLAGQLHHREGDVLYLARPKG